MSRRATGIALVFRALVELPAEIRVFLQAKASKRIRMVLLTTQLFHFQRRRKKKEWWKKFSSINREKKIGLHLKLVGGWAKTKASNFSLVISRH